MNIISETVGKNILRPRAGWMGKEWHCQLVTSVRTQQEEPQHIGCEVCHLCPCTVGSDSLTLILSNPPSLLRVLSFRLEGAEGGGRWLRVKDGDS